MSRGASGSMEGKDQQCPLNIHRLRANLPPGPDFRPGSSSIFGLLFEVSIQGHTHMDGMKLTALTFITRAERSHPPEERLRRHCKQL